MKYYFNNIKPIGYHIKKKIIHDSNGKLIKMYL